MAKSGWHRGFENFMQRVDTAFEKMYGVGHLDIPDWDYAEAFDSGKTPESTAMRAINSLD